MEERRAKERTRTLIAARMVFGGQGLAADCEIRNLSSGGAKLIVDEEIPVPTEFILEIPSKHRTHKARLVWRHADACGVAFDLEAEQAMMSDDAVRLRALEEENASLRRQIRALKAELAMRTHFDDNSL